MNEQETIILQKLINNLRKYNSIDTRDFIFNVKSFYLDERKLEKRSYRECWEKICSLLKEESFKNVNQEMVKIHMYCHVSSTCKIEDINFEKLYKTNQFALIQKDIELNYTQIELVHLKNIIKKLYYYDSEMNLANDILESSLYCHGNSINKTIRYIKELEKFKPLDISSKKFLEKIKLNKIKKVNIIKVSKALDDSILDIKTQCSKLTLMEHANVNNFIWKIYELLRLNNKEVTEEFESNIVSIYQDNLESLSFIGKQQVGQMVEEKLKKSKIPKTKFLWLKIDFLLKDEKKTEKPKKVKKI